MSEGETRAEKGRQIYSFDVTEKSGKMMNVCVSQDSGRIINKKRMGR